MHIQTVGIDIAKSVFHVVAFDERGKVIVKRKFSRRQLLIYMSNLSVNTIGMEASSGVHYLARALTAQGHTVRLMAPEYVKPYLKSNKNDFLDAEAIAEAVTRPTMRFVPIKTEAQLDMQAAHRVRERWMGRRTSLINQIRAFLLERGITVRVGAAVLRRDLPAILEDADNGLTPRSRQLLHALEAELEHLDSRLDEIIKEIGRFFHDDESCQRLAGIPGIGPIISTALIAAVGNATGFKTGRDMAAWLGLVPRQHSSGGKTVLLGISKHGNNYLRKLFVKGAQAAFHQVNREQHAFGAWLDRLEARKPSHIGVLALANKLARIAWAVLTTGQPYRSLA